MWCVRDNGSCEKSIVGYLKISQRLSVGHVEWTHTHTHTHTNTIIGAPTKDYCCSKLCVCYLWCLIWYFTLTLLLQRIMPTNYLMTVFCCPLSCFLWFCMVVTYLIVQMHQMCLCYASFYICHHFIILPTEFWWLFLSPKLDNLNSLGMPCVNVCVCIVCVYFCTFLEAIKAAGRKMLADLFKWYISCRALTFNWNSQHCDSVHITMCFPTVTLLQGAVFKIITQADMKQT